MTKFWLNEEDDIIGYIYKITNLINNKIYIGQTRYTIERRFKEHIWTSKSEQNNIPLQNAIRKYGAENFRIEKIDEASSKEELDEKEIYWIKTLNAQNPEIGYNVCRGGERGPGGPLFAGHKHSEETRAKMSADRMGSKNANYGNHRKMPEEEKQKHACPGEKNGMYGKHQSDEKKEKIRQTHLGKKAYSNSVLNKVIMLYPEDGEELIKNDPNWFEGNIHKNKVK